MFNGFKLFFQLIERLLIVPFSLIQLAFAGHEIGLGRRATNKTGERVSGKATDDEHHQGDGKVRQPYQQLSQHVGDGGQTQRVERYDECD